MKCYSNTRTLITKNVNLSTFTEMCFEKLISSILSHTPTRKSPPGYFDTSL